MQHCYLFTAVKSCGHGNSGKRYFKTNQQAPIHMKHLTEWPIFTKVWTCSRINNLNHSSKLQNFVMNFI